MGILSLPQTSSACYGRLRLFWETASQNNGRARRRWLRSQVAPDTEDMGPIALDDGAIREVRRDDGGIPDLPAVA